MTVSIDGDLLWWNRRGEPFSMVLIALCLHNILNFFLFEPKDVNNLMLCENKKYADHSAITPAYYGQVDIDWSGSYSHSRHWVELFIIGSFKILEKFIFRIIFSRNDMQPLIWEHPTHNRGTSATLPWQLFHSKQICSHNVMRVISVLYL